MTIMADTTQHGNNVEDGPRKSIQRTSSEGLQIAPQVLPEGHDMPIFCGNVDDGKELPVTNEKEMVMDEKRGTLPPYYSYSDNPLNRSLEEQHGTPAIAKRRKRRRCALIAAVVILILIAVIGGAVGGTLGFKKNKNGDSPDQKNSPTSPSEGSGGLALPTSSQASACRDTICTSVLKTISWSGKQFVFGLSSNKNLQVKSYDGKAWDSQWTDLGGPFAYTPTFVSRTSGKIDVIGVNTEKNMVWKTFSDNKWSETWTSLGTQTFASAPSAAGWSAGRLDVFALGSDGGLWHAYIADGNASFGSWETLGTPQGRTLVGAPTVAAWGSNRVDIFIRGSDSTLWHVYYDRRWYAWETMEGNIGSQPIVVSSSFAALDVFALNADKQMCWLGYHSQWYPWQCWTDQTFASMPIPVVVRNDRVDVLGTGTDDNLYHKSMTGVTWSLNFDKLGGPSNSAPAATMLSGDRPVVFTVGMDGQLYSSNFTSTSSPWETKSWNALGGGFAPTI